MDPDPEQSQDQVPDDASRPSYRGEETNIRSQQRLFAFPTTTLDIHPTSMRSGGSCLHCQQFDYLSTESDNKRSDVLLSSAQIIPSESAVLPSPMDDPALFPKCQSHHY